MWYSVVFSLLFFLIFSGCSDLELISPANAVVGIDWVEARAEDVSGHCDVDYRDAPITRFRMRDGSWAEEVRMLRVEAIHEDDDTYWISLVVLSEQIGFEVGPEHFMWVTYDADDCRTRHTQAADFDASDDHVTFLVFGEGWGQPFLFVPVVQWSK